MGTDAKRLAAMFDRVQRMDNMTLQQRYSDLMARPLLQDEADELQMVAQRLGYDITWWHMPLVPNAGWKRGRHDT